MFEIMLSMKLTLYGRESLVSGIPAGDGKLLTFFNGVVPSSSRTFDGIEGADDASQEDNDEKGE